MKKSIYFVFAMLGMVGYLYLIIQPILGKGYIYYRDVTEGLKIGNLYQRYIYTYSDDIGEALAEKARIPLFYLTEGVYQIGRYFGLDDSSYVKIKIILLFLISFLAFLLTIKKLVQKIKPLGTDDTANQYIALLAAFVGALYYTSNFWFTNRIMHFGLFFTTATIPILFYLFFDYVFSSEKKLTKLVVLAIFLALLTATPHTTLIELVIVISILASYFISGDYRKNKQPVLFLHLGIFLFLFLLLNAYWILPYLVSLSKPEAVVTETIINLIGRYANFQNSIRLMGYWLTDPSLYLPKDPADLWPTISYIPIFLTVVALFLLWVKKQRGLFWSILILLLAGVFLATSGQITNFVYFWLIFNSPLKGIGWVLREYDKFGIIISFVYSLSFSILIVLLSKKRLAVIALLDIIALVLIMNINFLEKTITQNYLPQQVPQSYFEVIDAIAKDNDVFNVAWYPGNPKPFWSSSEEVRYVFTNLISPKPSITTNSELMNYLDFLFNQENIYSIDLGRALDLIGVKYLVVRKDELVFGDQQIEDLFTTQSSLKKILGNDILSVYENTRFTGVDKIYTNRIETNMGLAFLKHSPGETFGNLDTFIDYSDKPSGFSNIPSKYNLQTINFLDPAMADHNNKFIFPSLYCSKKEDGEPGEWKLGSLENLTHAELSNYFADLGLSISQFDFGNGVILAREGWQLADKQKHGSPLNNLTFSGYPNMVKAGQNYKYISKDTDYKYYWDIIKSDRFTVQGMKALQVSLRTNIPDSLLPHFKAMYYTAAGKITNVTAFYPNEKGQINTILAVPDDAETADFSIWTVSGVPGTSYRYTINDLQLNDVSNNVKPVEFGFTSANSCRGQCTVYIRALDSYLSGSLELDINNTAFELKTKPTDPSLTDRFTWFELGSITNPGPQINLKLKNLSGLNAVNAIVFLNQEDNEKLLNNISDLTKQVLLSGPIKESTPSASTFISTIELNPTKYLLNIQSPQKLSGILAFAKPFNKNWVFSVNSNQPKLINGYINGWQIDNLDSGEYTIEYKPQRFFNLGVITSSVTALLAIIYVVYIKVVMASERKSKSQG